METLGIRGGCFCGQVRYQATARPSSQTLCHCANCRRAAGAQALAWVTFPAASFTYVAGTPASYRAPNGALWSFCPRCGTTLTYRNDGRPNEVDVTTGSLDDPDAFAPTRDTFMDEKLCWVPPAAAPGGT